MRFVVAGLIAVLGLAGCSAEVPSADVVEHPKAERPADRDERAVFAALAQLDFCAVLGAAAPGRQLLELHPSSCTAGPLEISMSVGERSDSERLSLPSRPIGGAKAYVRDNEPDTGH